MGDAIYPIDLSGALPENSPTRAPVRTALKYIAETLLWIVAIVALGWFAYVKADAYFFQEDQNRRMNALLLRERAEAAESVAAPSATAPAETAAATPPIAVSPGDLVARIDIPRLKVSEAVIEGDDAGTLRHAVGHIPGTALPGQPGNIGLAGHRDSFFRKIGELHDGDTLVLETARGTFSYHVAKTVIVAPNDTAVLAPSGDPALTLVTCYPFHYIGSAPKRYVVTAR